ncbi:MAG: HAMP domain-containing histidine kinase [Deltaproteobacteria bacterium]|nr:MAG: HAMP domain-containing histidine kinase [Deltaproteobacteria bacterium]
MPPSVESASRINLRWIVRLRWGAVVGQVVTILLAARMLHEALPVKALLGVCAALALVNLGTHVWLLKGGNPSERASGLNLLGDVLALTALLALSGGAYNPFAVLYLVHITIAAVVLPPRWSLALTAVSIAAYTLLQLMPEGPLLVLGGEDQLVLHARGRWVAFVVAAVFIGTFTLRMSGSLRRREAELERTRSGAEAAERLAALGTLAAGTAHELNTPLGTIAILAGELAAQLEGDRRAEAEEIRNQVQRCKQIITGMLAPRGGADLEEPKEFEVAPVLEAAVKRWQEGRPGPKPVLDIQPQATRARARLPVHAFERAIANLLDNAAEATENRPAREVRIGLSRSQGELRIQVSDNGIGVPEPLLRRIGEPFFTTKEPGRGTGLGLYLARHVVERQGGEMRVASAEGRGTEVILTVPEAGA